MARKKSKNSKMSNIYRKILSGLLISGMLVSMFLVYEHFSYAASEFCSFGSNLDCGVVNKSPYANLDGISYLLTIDLKLPLPLIDISGINILFDFLTTNAFLGFITLLFILLININNKKDRFLFTKKRDNINWIRGVLIFGVFYGGYLFLIQHFILKTYCVFCIILDAIMIVSLILSFIIKK